MSTRRHYHLFCDGASRKDGRGGWGFVVYENQVELFSGHGGMHDTTNNRMELTAAIKGLRSLPLKSLVTVYCDSKYVVDGITEHLDVWLRNGWRAAGNKPVKNQDLWQVLGEQDVERDTRWVWVKGHTGVAGNERADQLAGLGIPKEKSDARESRSDSRSLCKPRYTKTRH